LDKLANLARVVYWIPFNEKSAISHFYQNVHITHHEIKMSMRKEKNVAVQLTCHILSRLLPEQT
jgi:hypothetical protein